MPHEIEVQQAGLSQSQPTEATIVELSEMDPTDITVSTVRKNSTPD